MNYANHDLRTQLQEWRNRLYRASHEQFGSQLKYFLSFLDSNAVLNTIIQEIQIEYPLNEEEYEVVLKRWGRTDLEFDSQEHEAAYKFQFLKLFIKENTTNLQNYSVFNVGNGMENQLESLIEEFLVPIFYVFHDRLDKSSSVIYLLERYKKRTEWFTRKSLFETYARAEKNYEQILEDDLRLFLFDQGIEYPFSTPSSSTGRADIVGEIETDDPLVVEIKIFDRTKGYGKNRVKEGFSQIVKYANDYNKDVGYLVIYNMDTAHLNLSFSEAKGIFPPRIFFDNKSFYFIVVHSGQQISASKGGKIEEVIITEEELTKKL